jgi:hypothetical protein
MQKIRTTVSNQSNWLFEGQADYVGKKVYGLSQYAKSEMSVDPLHFLLNGQ